MPSKLKTDLPIDNHPEIVTVSQPSFSQSLTKLSPRNKFLLALSLVFLVALPLLMIAVLTQTRLNSRASNLRLTATPITPPTPTPTCKPRPKCLDVNPPCKIKDVGYCPKPTPTRKPTPKPCLPRPACLDAKVPCKLDESRFCPKPTPTRKPTPTPTRR